MKESSFQKKIKIILKNYGCIVNKVDSRVGWPDLEAFCDNGKTIFIEVKKNKNKPREVQKFQLERLKKKKHYAVFINEENFKVEIEKIKEYIK